MNIRAISRTDECEYDDCDALAEDVVYSRKLEKVVLCCRSHADVVIEEGSPEYWHDCENCECRTPVN